MPGRMKTTQCSIHNLLSYGLQTLFKWLDKKCCCLQMHLLSPQNISSLIANAGVASRNREMQGTGMQGRAVEEEAVAQGARRGLRHQARFSLHGSPSWQGMLWLQVPLEGSLPCRRGSSLCSRLTASLRVKHFMRRFAFQSSLYLHSSFYFHSNLQRIDLQHKDAGCEWSVGPDCGVWWEAMGICYLPVSRDTAAPLHLLTLWKFKSLNDALHCT